FLLGRSAGAQSHAKRGNGKDAAGESSQHKCRILWRVFTSALSTGRQSDNQRNRERNRQDGFLHRQSLFCLGPGPVTIESLVVGACDARTALCSGQASLLP